MAYVVTTKDKKSFFAGFSANAPWPPVWTENVEEAKQFGDRLSASAQGIALCEMGAQQKPVWVGGAR